MPSHAVLTVDQKRAAEKAAMDGGISEWELMQRAGEGAADWVARMAGGRSVCVLCGPGNNGGDGYVIAESLRKRGLAVSVVAPKEPGSETSRNAREYYEGEVSDGALPEACVYVDCLFGYGLSRKVEGDFACLLAGLRDASGFKIAIDVPSSIVSDTGELLGPEVGYDLTLALGAWKRAHVMMPAIARMGVKRLVDIGIELPDHAPRMSLPPRLMPPAADAHKYRRGLLAIVAGEMLGAPLLSAEAAMRSGAGYVKLLSEHSHPDAPAELVIDGAPLPAALEDTRIGAVLVGPGLGRREESREKLAAALSARKPAVLDADALHLLDPSLLENADRSMIAVTSHEGELAALCETFEVRGADKIARAQELHAATGMTVLAKGPDSVLAGAEGLRFFTRGSSWLSAAGTGDVLAGIAASRLAVHGEPQRALEEAVWLHHEAARLAGPAFTAGQLAHAVKPAMETYL
ncbi:NAD(P)H-hydrate epimerase [Qipengyuania sp. 1NDH17]|uniref:Bifunctional NAD(P)H-hydrate repair enzyme n=1 Tax=Qipengyuania polymorpha TaxID=2867234 RepID=A0ABS7IVJ7_9SPHN|nr:NAD(P)H-hydrate epimerase [Qipengyuania polymorpha]MBX7457488.1 NAD(P)H-hydrate epimerase [Qipengyuania polymorpha]